ncbi:MAG: signal peptidase II [Nanoarchaeota archaeon]
MASVGLFVCHRPLAPWKGGEVLSGVLLGGVLGNFIDRIAFGVVTDFIQLGPWPAFNIADSALTLGIIAIVYESWRRERA